ncbi:MAG: carboxyl transferase domain-containing protein, partial [bacterium]
MNSADEQIGSPPPSGDVDFKAISEQYEQNVETINELREQARKGGGDQRWEKQHQKGRMTARERIHKLVDDTEAFVEYGLLASLEDEDEFPAAGIVTGLGEIENRTCAIVAHDATVKAGSHIRLTCRKTLHMQELASRLKIPIIYLVDSSGIYLPRQTEVFADEGHFGSIFYNNSRMSADGIPQIAAIMGPCVAGGAYLPALCDEILMVEGSHLFIAGPGLVKAAIGQEVDADELGGAELHEEVSGTVDQRYEDDESCIEGIRSRVRDFPADNRYLEQVAEEEPVYSPDQLYGFMSPER